jgi:hypothetical protein
MQTPFLKNFLASLALLALTSSTVACKKTPSVAVRIDPALAALIPNGTKYLMVAKLDKLKDTATYQRHFKDRFADQFEEFARNTGMDPRKDLWQLVLCSDGKRSVMMGRGKFAIADLEPRLEREGAERFRYKNHNFFGDERNAGVFINVSTAVVGDTDLLKEIVDRQNNPSIPAALQPLIEAIPDGTQFFVVFDGLPLRLPEMKDPNMANLARVAGSVESGWMALNLSRGMNAAILANCKDEKMAEGLNGAARGLLGFARLSTPSDRPEVLKAIDAVDVKQEQRKVRLSANLSEDVFDNLVNTGLLRLLQQQERN